MSDFQFQQEEQEELQQEEQEELQQEEQEELQQEEQEELQQEDVFLSVPSPDPVYFASVETSIDSIPLDTNLNDLGLLGEALLIILLFVAIIALKRGD